MRRVARRTVLRMGVALAAAPLAVRAQPASRVWRIGFLTNGSVASAQGQLDAFVRGLAEQGLVEGRHYAIASRWAEGRFERLPELVDDLLAQRPDLIYAPSGVAAQAVRQSGTTLPIVFAFAPDPIGQGFGASLSRPGGTMTGLTSTHGELSAKRIEILREAFPSIRRLAVLYFLAPSGAGVAEQLAETERVSKALGLPLFAEESPRPDDFQRALASLQRQRPDALIVIENPMFYTNRVRLVELAATLRVPAIYNVSEYVRAGGLMCYGASYADLSRRAAAYAAKILRGTAPGTLAIERPIKFELVVNLATARAIGVTIPQAMLLRADEVIG